jgi:hypothetical protein
LLEQLNAAYDDAPDPEEEALLRAARHSYQRLVNDAVSSTSRRS